MKKNAISVYLFGNTAEPSSYHVAMQNRKEKTLQCISLRTHANRDSFSPLQQRLSKLDCHL
jgi:hypothetical protein